MTRLRALAAPIVLLLAGCAAAPPPAPAVPADDFAVLETLPPGDPVLGADLFPFETSGRRLRVVLPEDAADAVRAIRGEPTDRFGASFAVTEGEDRTDFLVRSDAGDTLSPAVITRSERALTRFEPPLLAAPAALPAGVPVEAEVAMRVLDAANPKRQREAGRATTVIEYVDDQRLQTPQGEVRAKRVVVHFTAKLRLARAERTTTYWVVPGTGVVAREIEEEVRVLGLSAKRVHERAVLEDGEKGDGEKGDGY